MTFIVFTSIPRPFPVINPTIPHLLFLPLTEKALTIKTTVLSETS